MSTLVAGPRIGGLELTSPTFPERHRLFPWIAGTVLRSIDPTLIICKGGGISAMWGPEIFTPLLTVSAMKRKGKVGVYH